MVTALAVTVVLSACGQSEAPDDATSAIHAPEIARLVPANEALTNAQIATLDPGKLSDAEIEKVLGTSSYCVFRYTSSSRPVLGLAAAGAGGNATAGVVKLNGSLIALQQQKAADPVVLAADSVQLQVSPDGGGSTEQQEADLMLQIGDQLKVGYRGYFACRT